jgi:hypothetical protein
VASLRPWAVLTVCVTAFAVVLAAGVAVPTADGGGVSSAVPDGGAGGDGVGVGVDTGGAVALDGEESGFPGPTGSGTATDTATATATATATDATAPNATGATDVTPLKLDWRAGGADRTPPADPALSPDRRPVSFSACLGVAVTGGELRLGADTLTRVRVRNVDTGETVTFAPDGPASVTVDWLSVCPYAAVAGELDVRPTGFDAAVREVSAPASGDVGTLSGGAYHRYVVEVLDGTGDVRAATPPRTYGVGVAVESLSFNGSTLAIDTNPAPPPDVTPVVVHIDGDSIERLRTAPTRARGEFVASVAGTAFDPTETVYVEMRHGESGGPPLVTLFRLSILPDERVDGPVGRPVATVPPPIVDGRPPTDPDGDGVYEDIDGSGTVTLVDVAVLLGAYDDPSVRDAVGYDVDGSGTVTLVDVAALLAEL